MYKTEIYKYTNNQTQKEKMTEKVLHEFKLIETEDGFRMEVKGDKERLKKMGFGRGMFGMGFGRGRKHGRRRGRWHKHGRRHGCGHRHGEKAKTAEKPAKEA